MEEHPQVYKSENFHFPRQIGLIKRLRVLSFVVNDITLIVSFFSIVFWIINLFGIKFSLLQQSLYSSTSVLFIFACIPLLFGAKRHLITTHRNAEKDDSPWWEFGIPIFFAAATALLGLINVISIANSGVLLMFHVSHFAGLCFFLIGIALIPPYTQILHRFHITQFLVFIVSGLNVFVILEHLYQAFSPHQMQQILDVSLFEACFFVFFCIGLLLRWANRGFLGNFTLDSTASIFAFRVFIINLFSAPLIALIVLFITRQTHYNMFVALTIVVVSFASISSILLWMNVKILYSHELEHLLMRESLRSHNIDLTKEQEELRRRMDLLEEEKQQYLEKLKSRNGWEESIERLSS